MFASNDEVMLLIWICLISVLSSLTWYWRWKQKNGHPMTPAGGIAYTLSGLVAGLVLFGSSDLLGMDLTFKSATLLAVTFGVSSEVILADVRNRGTKMVKARLSTGNPQWSDDGGLNWHNIGVRPSGPVKLKKKRVDGEDFWGLK